MCSMNWPKDPGLFLSLVLKFQAIKGMGSMLNGMLSEEGPSCAYLVNSVSSAAE